MRLGSPDQGLGQATFLRKSSFRMRPALLMTGLITTIALSWGCSGITSGNSSTQPPPPQAYNLSGTISPAAGGNAATVALSGAASATATANSSGSYTFTGLANGTYAVTPSHTGYTFSPTSQAATVSGANVTGINFTDAPQSATYAISGTISPAAGGSGATVTLSGAAGATTVTNASGGYSFSGLANGTYTVTPSDTGYAYSPASMNVTINAANFPAVNFTATVQQAHSVALSWIASTSTVAGYNVYRSTVSGTQYAKLNSSLVGVLGYTDVTVLGGTLYYYVTTAVDASGNESAHSNEVAANVP